MKFIELQKWNSIKPTKLIKGKIMGLSLSVHAGPVLLAEWSMKTVVVPHRGCNNNKCQRVTKVQEGKFCSQCGEQIVTFHTKTKEIEWPDYSHVNKTLVKAGLSEDALNMNNFAPCPPGFHVYEPNQNRGQRPVRGEDTETSDENGFIDISNIDIEAEKTWFATAFKPEIDALASIYASVSVHWVFMYYYS